MSSTSVDEPCRCDLKPAASRSRRPDRTCRAAQGDPGSAIERGQVRRIEAEHEPFGVGRDSRSTIAGYRPGIFKRAPRPYGCALGRGRLVDAADVFPLRADGVIVREECVDGGLALTGLKRSLPGNASPFRRSDIDASPAEVLDMRR